MDKKLQFLKSNFIIIISLLFSLSTFTSVMSQTDIAKLKANIIASTAKFNPNGYPEMKDCLNRINPDGSFNRTPKTALHEDLMDTLYKMVFTFLSKDSLAYFHQDSVKPIIYRALNYWLSNPPNWIFVPTGLNQTPAVGRIMIGLFNDTVVLKDAADIKYGPLLDSIKRNAKAWQLFAWNCDSDGTSLAKGQSKYIKVLGNNLTDDHHRIGNAAYRIPGLTLTAAAIGDSLMVDTINRIVNYQFPFTINKPGNVYNVGVTYDGSPFQHSGQFQGYGYGNDFNTGILNNYGNWVTNTKWAFDTAKQLFRANFTLNCAIWLGWYNTQAHNIDGRGNGMKGHMTYINNTHINNCYNNPIIKKLPIYSLVSSLRLRTIPSTKGGNLDSTKYFWNGQIIIQQSKNYFGTIRMLSNRITGNESSDLTTGQGLNNFHVGDGSAFIYHGKAMDYDTARVFWNWRCIPGITAKQTTGTLPLITWGNGYFSRNTLAGGVSDGTATIGVFYLDRTHTSATTKGYKSYFTFKDALICMGNSITNSNTGVGDIYTTLNQTTFRSNIYYAINGGSEINIPFGTLTSIKSNINAPSWYWHDSIGYIILPFSPNDSTNVLLLTDKRTGSWNDLDIRNNDTTTVSGNMFQLSINHGGSGNKNWLSNSYTYVIVPNVGKDSLVSFFNKRILTKTSKSLYINYNNNKIISASYDGYTAIFFLDTTNNYNKASALGYDTLSVSSNSYGGLLLKSFNAGMNFHVSDINSNFSKKLVFKFNVNRKFQNNSFTSPLADSSSSVIASSDSSIFSVCTSKISDIYYGEPIHFTAIDANTLPIELVEFEARNHNAIIQLHWQVKNQINVGYYNIQRSFDGIKFETIGSVKAIDYKTDYVSDDTVAFHFQTGKVYYRLQIVDNNGQISYSSIVSVKGNNTSECDINLYPNPVFGQLNLSINSNVSQKATFEIVEIGGKPLFQKQLLIKKGNSKYTLNISNLSKGNYLLICKNLNVVPISFIKQ